MPAAAAAAPAGPRGSPLRRHGDMRRKDQPPLLCSLPVLCSAGMRPHDGGWAQSPLYGNILLTGFAYRVTGECA